MGENQKTNRTEAPQTENKGAQTAVTGSAWKRFVSKKWVFPATYMAAAAIILTLMWVYQGAQELPMDESLAVSQPEQTGDIVPDAEDALPVTVAAEKLQWPVRDPANVEVIMPFFDANASAEEQQAAMLQVGDSFIPNVGLALAQQDDEPFDVLAAMSGTVTRVESNPLLGQLVEIEHENGMVTVYHSLSEVQVTQGTDVQQGDLLAKAGRSELGKELGVHVNFEVRQGAESTPVNPEELLAPIGSNAE